MGKTLILRSTLRLSSDALEKLRQNLLNDMEEGCAIILDFLEVVNIEENMAKDESEAAEL